MDRDGFGRYAQATNLRYFPAVALELGVTYDIRS